MGKGQKVPVTRRALIQRINRIILAAGSEQLKSARGQAAATLGHYYIVDLKRNSVARKDVDVTALAREMGVLQPWEQLEEDAK